MKPLSAISALALATCMVHTTAALGATDYPNRPIRLIVPYAVGGSTDLVARQYGDLLSRELKQTVVIENRPGASTNIGNKLVADANPDGYTLLYGTGQMTLTVTFGPFPAVDPLAAFEPISLILTSPQMIASNINRPFTNATDFLDAARKTPKGVSIATAQLHMYVNLLNVKSDIELLHVPYKGGAPAVTDTIGGRTDVVMGQPPVLLPFIRHGELKPIAMLSKERLEALPDVQTFAEIGLPEVEVVTWNAVLAPKGTPGPVVERLAEATRKALADPSLARLKDDGISIRSSTPDELSEQIKRDVAMWKKLAADHPDLLEPR